MSLIVAIALGYLLGSIPFGIVITRALGLGDLRQIGSGNIGATNVLRTGHKPAALATLVLDAGKGGVAALIAAGLIGPETAAWAGLAAFVGHCYPVWLRFRGGKGVATLLGIALALNVWAFLAAGACWLALAGASRISSVGGMGAAVSVPVWMALLGRPDAILAAALMAALALWRHRANIARLLSGTEPRIKSKSA